MKSDLTFIVITLCFWYWTTSKIAITISPLREENRWQKRIADASFAVMLAIQLIITLAPDSLSVLMTGVICSILVAAVLICSKFDGEGFWSKPRNQIVGGATLIAIGLGLPLFCDKPVIVPVIFTIIIAHGFHKSQLRIFSNSLKDLDSIKAKVAKLQSDLHNTKVESLAKRPREAAVFMTGSDINAVDTVTIREPVTLKALVGQHKAI